VTAACLDLGLRGDRPPVVFGLDEPWYLSPHSPPGDLAPPDGAVVHALRYGARDARSDRAELVELARTAGVGEAQVVEERFLARMVVTHVLPSPDTGLGGRPLVAVAGAGGLFEAERRRLTGLAYRVTGSVADAEDVVQEAWLRWTAADQRAIANPAGWLTTVTSRMALDHLRAQRRRRESYVGPWLPEPVATDLSPEEQTELAESLTVGFLVLLDRLGPAERVAFLLGDVFGEPYEVIAGVLDKRPEACRQLVSRARRKIRGAGGDPAVGRPAPAKLLTDLVGAVLVGDEQGALALLDPDVVLVSDGGPNRRAARHPVMGAVRVHRLLTGGWRLFGFPERPHPDDFPPAHLEIVNSTESLVFDAPEGPVVVSAEALAGRIVSIWVRLNPEKTGRLGAGVELR